MPYGPAGSKDLSGDLTDQVVSRGGVFYGVFIHDASNDVLCEVFDGAADTAPVIWMGFYEFTNNTMTPQPGSGGVSFSAGLFVKFSAAPDVAAVHFA